MSTGQSTPRGFRPDIQGMRALAVGTVILAHSGFRSVSGGFVGVDVFFVISGFLITSLLVREADRSGRISLLGFYARRARRILPAALVVAVATVLAALIWLPLLRAVEVITDSIWAAAFGANIRFAQVGTDYFAKGEPASPLQHYWSLSVEEQYYLVWPLILIGWLWLSARRIQGKTAGPPSRRTLLITLGVLCAASFAWSLYATYHSPTTAYFSTLTRAWELGAGSAVAIAMSRPGARALPRWLPEAGGVLGLVLILAAVVGYSPQTHFPGYQAALPILGTVLLLWSGGAARERAPAMARLLSIAPARIVGDWSYSLYLWHWPVLRIAEDHLGHKRLPLPTLTIALVGVFVLSWLTYRFVETPFRTGRAWSRPSRGVALYPLSLVLVIAVALGGRSWVDQQLGAGGDNPAITTTDFEKDNRLSDDPTVALVQASVLAAREGQPVPSDLTPPLLGLRKDTAPLGECDYRTGTTKLCPNGDVTADRSIVLLGDSHARAWSPAVSKAGELSGYATYNLVFSGCSATTAVQADIDTLRPWEPCEDFKAWAMSAIAELEPELIIVATSAVSPIMDPEGGSVGVSVDRKRFREVIRAGFVEELRQLKALAPQVMVLGNTPNLPREPGVCLSAGDVDLGDCMFAPGPVAQQLQMDYKSVATEEDVRFVNSMAWFCYQKECPPVVGSTITMRDSEHMTTEYADQLGAPLAARLGL